MNDAYAGLYKSLLCVSEQINTAVGLVQGRGKLRGYQWPKKGCLGKAYAMLGEARDGLEMAVVRVEAMQLRDTTIAKLDASISSLEPIHTFSEWVTNTSSCLLHKRPADGVLFELFRIPDPFKRQLLERTEVDPAKVFTAPMAATLSDWLTEHGNNLLARSKRLAALAEAEELTKVSETAPAPVGGANGTGSTGHARKWANLDLLDKSIVRVLFELDARSETTGSGIREISSKVQVLYGEMQVDLGIDPNFVKGVTPKTITNRLKKMVMVESNAQKGVGRKSYKYWLSCNFPTNFP